MAEPDHLPSYDWIQWLFAVRNSLAQVVCVSSFADKLLCKASYEVTLSLIESNQKARSFPRVRIRVSGYELQAVLKMFSP